MIENYQEEMALRQAEPESESFAKVAGKYADGLSLLFPGQSQPSQKHYKCSRFGTFAVGDTVKVIKCSGTYIVEYPVGNPR